jgi:hypothetical protein
MLAPQQVHLGALDQPRLRQAECWSASSSGAPRLAAEPPEGVQGVGRPLGHAFERARGRRDVGEGRVAALDTEPGEPSQGGALEAVRFGLTDRDAHGQGVTEIDAG